MKITRLTLLLLATLLFGCASTEKANLSSTNPDDAVDEVLNMKSDLRKSQADVLAHESFAAGNKDLNEAMELIDKGGENNKTMAMDLLAQAKGHFQKSQENSKSIPKPYEKILAARKKALEADPYASSRNKEMLDDIDDDFIDRTDGLTENLSAQYHSQFQQRYQSLEVKSIQHQELKRFRNIYTWAQENDADSLAPKTLQKAKVDIYTAENAIAQSPRNSDAYSDEVMQANKSAKLLSDVMDKLLGSAKGSPENVAIELVNQERKVGKLSDTVGELAYDLTRTQQKLTKTSSALGTQYMKRLDAESQVRFQKALDEMRNSFTSDQAEAYQQGDRLIFRLKKIDFAPGSAEIPDDSKNLLSKIESIISEMDPKDIQIQGHTDSTGTNSWNQKLSLMRAKSVENYLSAKNDGLKTKVEGLGEQKPIATNETAEGRAQNRRVDIVIDVK